MYQNLKRRVLEANLMLPNHGLVTFTWGNLSEIDRDKGLVAIKPSGVDYNNMKVDDIVLVDLAGDTLEGIRKPSSDTLTHLELYKAFPKLGSVVHTHSKKATVWAQASSDIPALGTTHADYFHGDIPCTRPLRPTEIKQDYEKNTGAVIIEEFIQRKIDPIAIPGVIVSGHGPFSWGKDPLEAVHNAVVLEEVADMALATRVLNTGIRIQKELLDKHYFRKHGEESYYGQGR